MEERSDQSGQLAASSLDPQTCLNLLWFQMLAVSPVSAMRPRVFCARFYLTVDCLSDLSWDRDMFTSV